MVAESPAGPFASQGRVLRSRLPERPGHPRWTLAPLSLWAHLIVASGPSLYPVPGAASTPWKQTHAVILFLPAVAPRPPSVVPSSPYHIGDQIHGFPGLL